MDRAERLVTWTGCNTCADDCDAPRAAGLKHLLCDCVIVEVAVVQFAERWHWDTRHLRKPLSRGS